MEVKKEITRETSGGSSAFVVTPDTGKVIWSRSIMLPRRSAGLDAACDMIAYPFPSVHPPSGDKGEKKAEGILPSALYAPLRVM
jgi:hypothetical protein